MKRARHSSRISKKRKPFKSWIFEDLEPRRLLTTFVGGDQFRFVDQNQHVIQVNFFGNITAELIGAHVAAGNNFTLVDLPEFLGGPLPATPDGNTLFSIYVSSSDLNAGIAVSQVPYNPTTGIFGAPEPFTGSIGNLRVLDFQNGTSDNLGAPANTGAAILGAQTIGVAPGNNIAQLTLPVPVNSAILFPTLPTSFTTVNAGLVVAPGNSLGKFLFGGTVTGEVHIGGALGEFYCGWLQTGNAQGEDGVGIISDPQNFSVAGNLGKLYTSASIGVDTGALLQNPVYLSGFDLYVAGTIGVVQSLAGSVYGSIFAADLTGVPNSGAAQTETEVVGGSFANDELGVPAGVSNNTFATAQYISNSYNTLSGTDDSVVVDGTLQATTTEADHVDYYAVPLMAGQTITVQVQNGSSGVLTDDNDIDVGVFDPQGREIATDYNNNELALTQEKAFQITTTMPGVYRFAVAVSGDSMFTGGGANIGDVPYELSVLNVGHMAIGAIVASVNMFDNPDLTTGAAGFAAQSDDIGAIVAGGTLVSTSDNTVDVENGTLRCLEAGTIGGGAGTAPEISVPNGNVGLLESTGGALDFNQDGLDTPIGGSYEVISSSGGLEGEIVADGNIGTIRAASIGGSAAFDCLISVDANNVSNDGTIDLIDDSGDYGNANSGGPPILTGPHGDLRYMHVLGNVYQDPAFGDILPMPETFPAVTPDQVVDDSGAVVTLTPIATAAVPAPQLTVTTFSLEGGGSAIVNVTSTGGLGVATNGNVAGQVAEIGAINVGAGGNVVTPGVPVVTPGGNTTAKLILGLQTVVLPPPPVLTLTTTPVNLLFGGTSATDVFDVTGGAFDEIANNTPGGEIVNIAASSIGTLTGSDPIGLNLEHNTPAQIMPLAVISNAYPFSEQRTGVNVSGSIVTVSQPVVGNLIVGGSVGTINGTIEAPVEVTGSINSVDFQKGIYPSGTGNLANAGIFANGVIGTVSNSQPGDIRGNVISDSGIIGIHVNNGSIIGATLGTPTSFASGANINGAQITIINGGGTLTTPILDVGSISTSGNGGIIGTNILTANIGTVTTTGGFGIFTSSIRTGQLGSVGVVTTSGYGARQFIFEGGGSFGALIAPGNGALVSTANFSSQVQYSETNAFDPFFGTVPNALTDIDSYLGTSAAVPVIPGRTDTGIVENTDLVGVRTLRSVNAYEIRSIAIPVLNPLDAPSVFNFANNIVNISTAGPIDGLDITTGKLATLQTGGNLMHTTLQIAGRITNLIIRANFTDTSSIIAQGRNGNIGNLKIIGNMDGVIQADGGKINNVRIYGSLFGRIVSHTINNLTLSQSLGNGSLQISGNAGTIQFLGDLGSPGDTLNVAGKVNILRVAGNVTANVVIGKGLNQLNVGGSIVSGSKITVGSVLNVMKVGADFQAGAIVQAHAVKKIKIGGLNEGQIITV